MNDLTNFLSKKNITSKFKASLGNQGGYIEFSNTNGNTFAVNLTGILSCINDMLKRPDIFYDKKKYNETEWRGFGSNYITDPISKALIGVQTKLFFTLLSKIIVWANTPDLDTIDTDKNIVLGKDVLEKTSEKLTNLLPLYGLNKGPISKVPINQSPFSVTNIPLDIKKTGLLYSERLLYRFTISLITKPFVILSGLSGSGKTKLALAFAKWICEDESQMRLIPVGADWTNREYLLGYPNALNEGSYILPENKALNIILEAIENPEKPYFLILDEMNLSYVERYFADFLSAMESDEEIPLHPDTDLWKECNIPAKIKLPNNLFLIGTINVDETTYTFSPKVLDRANVIEFRISDNEMETFLSDIKPLNKDAADGLGADMASSFVELAKDKKFSLEEDRKALVSNILLNLFNVLKQAGAEFGYRTATEIYRFIAVTKKLNIEWNDDQIIDAVIMQKLLPKVHGSRKKIQPILKLLWELCLKEDSKDRLIENSSLTESMNIFSKYPLSTEKILRMYNSASDNGFTSFAEA
jgi:5-methylcytosine-specific restriction protein B